MKKNLVIILDPGHGRETPGKCSPDKTHFEYIWNREICNRLKSELESNGFKVFLTVKDDSDKSLVKRVDFANGVEGKNKLLLSIHNNAAGSDGQWKNATGYSVYTTRKSTNSDKCAEIILKQLAVDFPELKMRKDISDGDLDIEANFIVLMGATYKACLLEWMFQDSKHDLEIIESDDYKQRLIKSLAASIDSIDSVF